MSSDPVQGVSADTTPASQTSRAPVDTEYYLTEGLEGVEHQKYQDPESFTKAIRAQAKEALSGNAGQYAFFCPVTQDDLTSIDKIRYMQPKGVRFMYLNHEEALIVKFIIGSTHEVAHREFAGRIIVKAAVMGLEGAFVDMGAMTMSVSGGRKEGDSVFKPAKFRPYKQSWPTLAVECGVSESLARLGVDSRWWLENSGGEVKIVILISVSGTDKRIHLEKWEMASAVNRGVTSATPEAHTDTPIKTQEVDIVDDVVTGGPLHLEFEKLMLREPRSGEGDIVFDVQDLERFADLVWRVTQK